MNITNSADLSQAIQQGQHLQLNAQGDIETQSGISKFFQKIGDAFRALSASGREAIEARNAKLSEAVSRMLSNDDALPNLAKIDVPAKNEAVNHVVNKFVAHKAALTAVRDFPENIRSKAAVLVENVVVKQSGLNGKPDDIRTRAYAFALEILDDKDMMAALSCMQNEADPAKLEAMKEKLENRIDLRYDEDSPTDVLLEDAVKSGEFKSLNGETPLVKDCRTKINALVPDSRALANFIEVGIFNVMSNALTECLHADISPNGLPLGEDMELFATTKTTSRSYELSTEGDIMTVKLTVEREHTLTALDGVTGPSGESVGRLGSERYEVTMKFSLDQLQDKVDKRGFTDTAQNDFAMPEITVTDIKYTPLG